MAHDILTTTVQNFINDSFVQAVSTTISANNSYITTNNSNNDSFNFFNNSNYNINATSNSNNNNTKDGVYDDTENVLPFETSSRVLLATINGLIVLCVTVVNIPVLVVWCFGNKDKHTPTSAVVLNLIICDMSIAFGLCLRVGVLLDPRLASNYIMCVLQMSSCMYGGMGMQTSLFLNILDRFIAVVFPFRYSDIINYKSILPCVCVAQLFVISWSFAPLFPSANRLSETKECTFHHVFTAPYIYASAMYAIVLMVCSVALYSAVLRIAVIQQKKIHANVAVRPGVIARDVVGETRDGNSNTGGFKDENNIGVLGDENGDRNGDFDGCKEGNDGNVSGGNAGDGNVDFANCKGVNNGKAIGDNSFDRNGGAGDYKEDDNVCSDEDGVEGIVVVVGRVNGTNTHAGKAPHTLNSEDASKTSDTGNGIGDTGDCKAYKNINVCGVEDGTDRNTEGDDACSEGKNEICNGDRGTFTCDKKDNDVTGDAEDGDDSGIDDTENKKGIGDVDAEGIGGKGVEKIGDDLESKVRDDENVNGTGGKGSDVEESGNVNGDAVHDNVEHFACDNWDKGVDSYGKDYISKSVAGKYWTNDCRRECSQAEIIIRHEDIGGEKDNEGIFNERNGDKNDLCDLMKTFKSGNRNDGSVYVSETDMKRNIEICNTNFSFEVMDTKKDYLSNEQEAVAVVTEKASTSQQLNQSDECPNQHHNSITGAYPVNGEPHPTSGYVIFRKEQKHSDTTSTIGSRKTPLNQPMKKREETDLSRADQSASTSHDVRFSESSKVFPSHSTKVEPLSTVSQPEISTKGKGKTRKPSIHFELSSDTSDKGDHPMLKKKKSLLGHIRRQSKPQEPMDKSLEQARRDKRRLRQSGAATVVFCICWIPFATTQLVMINGGSKTTLAPSNVTSFLILINAFLNPFIFVWGNVRMRTYMMNWLLRRKGSEASRDVF